uniref:Fatty acid synthase n=1 Tax=Blattella germanica TaxID=6973 RepID=A0A5B7QXM6_BLAGE|nr:fatty acid synthase 6 [Blattella germanica]
MPIFLSKACKFLIQIIILTMSPQNQHTSTPMQNEQEWLPRNQVYGQWDPNDDIVIAGVSGRFPESENVEEFMENLYGGVNMVVENDRRWPIGFCNLPGCATLKDASKFDASYFGVPPKLVNYMDPQLRIILELTYEAILDAGINPAEIRGSKTGVYYALTGGDADQYFSRSEDNANGYGFIGSCKSMFANRISFQFDFTGPSFAVDTGCATSLIALNQAITDMRVCRVDAAIVCSSNIMLNPYYSQHLSKLGVLAPVMEPKVFDTNATGYVRGEAAVVLYLVRKSAARRVYANIVHVRNNTDGYKTAGIATPSGEMQYQNNSATYKEAGVNPLDVVYIEAHGTGTKVGDPEELNSLADLFCKKRSNALLVGSLKSNMGHAESTAGLCSMMKVVLAMQTGLIPPNLHFKDPNPGVPALFDGRMKVVDKIETLPGDYVGVNAFGLGGSNSHVVMRRHEKIKSNVAKDQLPRLVAVSGRTEAAVNYFLDKIDAMPRDDDCVALLHEIHKSNISKHNYRGFTITNTKSPSRNVSQICEDNRPVWFVCTGWGAQWLGQTKELMKIQVFERRIKMCSKVLEKKGINLYDIITKESNIEHENFIEVFLTIGATQLALIDLLRLIGIKPDALLGISTGELTCAYIDGAVTAEQVMLIAYHTAVWTTESNLPAASMAVVCGLTYNEVKALCPPGIYVAVHNDIRTCTVVGPKEQIPNFVNTLLSKGIIAKLVKTSAGVAFHTPIVAKEAENLAHKIQKLLPNSTPAGIHWVSSSVHAENGKAPLVQKFSADYFMNIVTDTVLVQEALMHIPDNAIVVEISPHCALQLTLRKVLPASALSVPLMFRDEPFPIEFMLSGLGKLYNAGVQMNLANLYPKVSFPVARGTHMINSMIQWDHSVEWSVPNVWYKARKDGSKPNKCSLTVDIADDKYKYLTGHVVNQQPMFPHAGYLQLVWKAFAQVNKNWFENIPVRLDNVQFHENTYIPDSGVLSFVVKFGDYYDNTSDFELYENNRILSSGSISKLDNTCEILETREVQTSLSENESDILPLTTNDIYMDFRLRGFQYSGCFCSVKESDNRGTTGIVDWQKNWVTFLDSLLQFVQIGGKNSELSLPRKLKKIIINPQEHLSFVEEKREEIRVKMQKEQNLIKGGGVQLQGLEFYIEHQAREEQNEPEIEKQIFVPYVNRGAVKLGDSSEESCFNALSVLLQIIQENVGFLKQIKIVEFADSLKEEELLSPTLVSVIKRQPECKADITVLSQTPTVLKESTLLESLHIKVEDSLCDAIVNADCNLVIGNGSKHLSNKILPLSPGGFLLFEKALNEDEIEIPGFYLVATQHTTNTAFVLMRKDLNKIKPAIVEVTNNNFDWLGKLRGLLRINKYEKNNIFLVSEEEYQCGIMGFTKCLMREPGCDNIRCVFLQDLRAPKFSIQHPLYSSQLEKDLRVNVYREGVWGTLRHINLGLKKNSVRPTEFAQVEVLHPGDLSSISWIETPLKFQRSEINEQLCHVYYASVNLMDVLLASRSSRIQDWRKSLLGQEFSGYNCSGQRLMGISPEGALSTRVVASSQFLWKVPTHWTLEQAASVPSAYLIGFYALEKRGRIQKDEWVLIHNATSAVGQAAITICQQKGCNIIATVCNDHERNTFRNIFHNFSQVHLVYSGCMETQVMAITKGRGVDVALNSLETNQQNKALLHCLKDDGRFLDLALPQLNKSMNLGRSSLQNKSYHNILLDTLFRPDNTEREEVLKIMTEGLDSGVVQPLPTKVLPRTEIEKAFRYVMDTESSKKVIIKIHEETKHSISEPERKLISAIPKLFVDPEKMYVLAGGLGGFGMELAHWLIQRGARKLALTSRRGVTMGYKSLRIRRWRENGITIITSTEDVTTEYGAEKLLNKCGKLGSIGGIFILSMVLKDALLENQSKENFQEVCKAKVDVARSLDAMSQRLCPELEYFVAFSSIASGRGNVGQSAYGMANSTLERICEERRMLGLPALAVQWGPIGDVGVLYDSMGNDVVLVGTVPQHISSCLDAFEDLLRQPHAVLTSHVLVDKELENGSSCVLEKDFLNTVANVLGIKDLSRVPANSDVQDLGIDSLMSTEIKNTLQEQFSIKLSSQEIYRMMASTLRDNSA